MLANQKFALNAKISVVDSYPSVRTSSRKFEIVLIGDENGDPD